jgi:hypothetical protein
MDPKDFRKTWGKLIAKAWLDELFKKRLLADPAGVLQENGIKMPGTAAIRIVEDSDQVVHLILPARPQELSEAELEKVAGGIKGAELVAEAMAYKPRIG